MTEQFMIKVSRLYWNDHSDWDVTEGAETSLLGPPPPRPSALTWPPSRRSFHPRRVFCSTCAQLELGYQRLTQCSFLVELILLSCSTEVQTWKWAENRTFTCTCVGMWYENSLTSFFSFIFCFFLPAFRFIVGGCRCLMPPSSPHCSSFLKPLKFTGSEMPPWP